MPKNPSTKRKAEIYRKAARSVEKERQWACCPAIKDEVEWDPKKTPVLVEPFLDLFCPTATGYDGRRVLWSGERDIDRGPRVLALCFMAAMVEAGDA